MIKLLKKTILIKQSFSLQVFHMVMRLFHRNKVLLRKVSYMNFHFLSLIHFVMA